MYTRYSTRSEDLKVGELLFFFPSKVQLVAYYVLLEADCCKSYETYGDDFESVKLWIVCDGPLCFFILHFGHTFCGWIANLLFTWKTRMSDSSCAFAQSYLCKILLIKIVVSMAGRWCICSWSWGPLVRVISKYYH